MSMTSNLASRAGETEMTMLLIDLHSSTDIVDGLRRQAAAKMSVTSDDLWVDPFPAADDHAAVMMIDRGATLITSPLVSQCH